MSAKVVIAKVAPDGHDRGTKVMVRALEDAGFEVVYRGIRQTPRDIANDVCGTSNEFEGAVQEDVLQVAYQALTTRPGVKGKQPVVAVFKGQNVSESPATFLALSSLIGARLEFCREVLDEIRKRGCPEPTLFFGGIVERDEVAELERLGFRALFGPYTRMQEVVDWVTNQMPPP